MHPLILLASALPLLAHAQTQQSQLPNSCIPITSKSACSPFSDQISSVYPSRISPQLAVASSFNLDSYIATLLDSDNFCEYYGCTALPKSANNSQASIVSQIRYATSYACASTLVNAASPCSGNQVKYWSTEKCAVYIESFRSVLKQCTEQGASFTERRTLAIQNSETACRAIALSENGENLNLVLAVASDLGTCGFGTNVDQSLIQQYCEDHASDSCCTQLTSGTKKEDNLGLILGCVFGALILIGLIFLIFYCLKRQKRNLAANRDQKESVYAYDGTFPSKNDQMWYGQPSMQEIDLNQTIDVVPGNDVQAYVNIDNQDHTPMAHDDAHKHVSVTQDSMIPPVPPPNAPFVPRSPTAPHDTPRTTTSTTKTNKEEKKTLGLFRSGTISNLFGKGTRSESLLEAPPPMTQLEESELPPPPIFPVAPTSPTEPPQPQPIYASQCALYAYCKNLSDEMDLEEGDEVDVVHHFDDGWIRGVNKRTGETGVVPGVCLGN